MSYPDHIFSPPGPPHFHITMIANTYTRKNISASVHTATFRAPAAYVPPNTQKGYPDDAGYPFSILPPEMHPPAAGARYRLTKVPFPAIPPSVFTDNV